MKEDSCVALRFGMDERYPSYAMTYLISHTVLMGTMFMVLVGIAICDSHW